MTAGQLSIFDELADAATDTITCPHCGWSWAGDDLGRHIAKPDRWPIRAGSVGHCENQRIRLHRVSIRSNLGPYPFGEPVRDSHELLWAILGAKENGCTDKQIQQVIS